MSRHVPYRISSDLCPPAALVGARVIAELLSPSADDIKITPNLRSPAGQLYHRVETQQSPEREPCARIAVELAQIIHHEALLPERDRFVDPADVPPGVQVVHVRAADDEAFVQAVLRTLDEQPTARLVLLAATEFSFFEPPVEPLEQLVRLLSRLGQPDYPLRNLDGLSGALVNAQGELCLPEWMVKKHVLGGLERQRDVDAGIRRHGLDQFLKPGNAGHLHRDDAGVFLRRSGLRYHRHDYKSHHYKIDGSAFLLAHPNAAGEWVEFMKLANGGK